MDGGREGGREGEEEGRRERERREGGREGERREGGREGGKEGKSPAFEQNGLSHQSKVLYPQSYLENKGCTGQNPVKTDKHPTKTNNL